MLAIVLSGLHVCTLTFNLQNTLRGKEFTDKKNPKAWKGEVIISANER